MLAAALLVGSATLWPTDNPGSTATFCIVCGDLGGVDFVLNVVLFMPLGVGLRWLLGRWSLAALAGFGVTLLVETLQWRLIRGRDASLGDVLANTLGTIVGVWIAVEGPRWLNATPLVARRLARVLCAARVWDRSCVVVVAAARSSELSAVGAMETGSSRHGSVHGPTIIGGIQRRCTWAG